LQRPDIDGFGMMPRPKANVRAECYAQPGRHAWLTGRLTGGLAIEPERSMAEVPALIISAVRSDNWAVTRDAAPDKIGHDPRGQ